MSEKEPQKEYSIQELSKLAGVSSRTLRYYDQIGLLTPSRTTEAGYRIYGEKEVRRLQEILFYREFGIALADIQTLLCREQTERTDILRSHLAALRLERSRLNALIRNLTDTIQETEGELIMKDKERFEGFKKELIEQNEEKYGAEIRSKYGDQTIDESNARLLGLSKEEFQQMQELEITLRDRLEQAVLDHADPAGETGRELIDLHRRWLSYSWKHYSPEAHLGLTQMYVADERFTAYYDKQVTGCAQFLYQAAQAHLGQSSSDR